MIAWSRPRTTDIRRDRRPELQEPPPDRLVGCVNTSLGEQFLDIPKGQCEPGIEPDRVADDFWREAVALKRYRSHPMMLIGDEPQSYPSYRDIAVPRFSARDAPAIEKILSATPLTEARVSERLYPSLVAAFASSLDRHNCCQRTT